MNIVFLGSGNTATVLAQLMTSKGHRILQVWSRNPKHADELAEKVSAKTITTFGQIDSSADICVLAIADDAVAAVAATLAFQKKIAVHTAGSVSIQVLKNASPNYGVLYPLQSLKKNEKRIPEIPFLVDGNSDDVKALLSDFAQTFSNTVVWASDEERLKLHLAAVVVNNFTNHLYAVTEDYCTKQSLNFQLLYPLIKETAFSLENNTADQLQTGPAKRGDEQTIQKHLQLLENDKRLQNLYQIISNSILHTYHKKEELSKSKHTT